MTEASEPLQTSEENPFEVSSTRLRWWGALRVVGTLAFVGAVLVGAVTFVQPDRDEAFGWVTVVIGNWVPSPLTAEVVLLVAGTGAFLTAMLFVPCPPERPWRELRIFIAVVLAGAVPLSLFVVADGSNYSVLPEQSEGGCRIVVREYSFFLLGEGSVGIVQPGSVTVDWLRGYLGDDGYAPFSRDTYTLDWHGKTAALSVFGSPNGDAAWFAEQPSITCIR
ncbi:hypothetical protein [Mycetocola zhadangensis]|uniref:Uncharacterized protein n=1 Tax=Mycetocola zhadangensis TaxID=1164595 RepID=A0A3L7ISF9_9MICO|nr:hypothetical protein [Mycetocola zhadangensis]RLQ81158.1 hypothetical protein D9V28_15585 [Mycetocola zhadangensis]GGF05255.1 hypothetical protein GCM10011313_30500 [Mycetocola zhadangensis]